MRIQVVCPEAQSRRTGNSVTARRWRRILQGLGHEVTIRGGWDGDGCDLLVALHATKSHDAVAHFRERHPDAPLVVALTGTDLYRDLPRDTRTRRSLELASRIVVLHPRAAAELQAPLRRRAFVILQSAVAPPARPGPSPRHFDVAVVAHLRAIKDPFRAEEAVRSLPGSSRLRVLHAGGVLEAGFDLEARERQARNPRYRWLGELPGWKARRLIARSRLLGLTSKAEGGANVVSESVVAGVPVLASRIPCSEGLLGPRYPGLFPAGDTGALRRLLLRCEENARFLGLLAARCRERRSLFSPARERRAWRSLLASLSPCE